jgi:lipopolysaccharide/colanic/teichoic acid biosynthesis glycosyltransferase
MKSKAELAEELRCIEVTKQERETSNRLYAIKLVEIIVFTLVGLILTGVFVALVNLVIKK